MLLAFHLVNYRSYRSPASIYLERRSLKTNHPQDGDWVSATHRVTGIFGANAAGKSNVLIPIIHLEEAVKNSLSSEFHLFKLRSPHRLSEAHEPTAFLTEYVYDNIRYKWELVLDDNGILEESLQANPFGQWRKIYFRERDQIDFGALSGIPKGARDNIRQFASPWALTMSAWTTVKSQGPFSGAEKWWRNRVLSVEAGEQAQNLRHEWLKTMLKNPSWLRLVSIVVQVADVGINSIKLDEREVPPEIRELVQRISEAMSGGDSEVQGGISMRTSSTIDQIQRSLRFTHEGSDRDFTLPEENESVGTRAWLDTAIPALYALITGSVLVVDEIDGSLHTSLVRQILDFFSDPILNSAGAQLVFTSHDLSLLGNHPRPALNRESTWLAEKKAGESTLISIDEFKLRENNNFEKQYLQGAFGALPKTSTVFLAKTIQSLRSEFLAEQDDV